MELATKKSGRVLINPPNTAPQLSSILHNEELDRVICSILREENCSWPVDWPASVESEFLERVAYHGSSALLNKVLSKHEYAGRWPHPVLQSLANQSRSEAVYDLLRAHWAGLFFSALKEAKIRFVVMKGEAVARLCYDRSFYRTRSDTDVFINVADIENVKRVMKSLAIVAVPPFYKAHQFSGVVGMGSSAPVVFDIHWRISNNPAYALLISFKNAWERSVPLAGVNECRSLNLVDSLLLACVHRRGNKSHDPNRLVWLMDIHLLAASFSNTDWREFTQLLNNNRLEGVCLEGLETSNACFGTAIPEQALDQMKTTEFKRAYSTRYRGSNLSLLIEDFKSLPGIGSRATLLRELFVPHPDSLMGKFGKTNRTWLPWLYFKQIFLGLIERLSLK